MLVAGGDEHEALVGARVDQLGRARRRLDQHAVPGERVLAVVAALLRSDDGDARDRAGPVGADHNIRDDLEGFARGGGADDARLVALGVLDGCRGVLEQRRDAVSNARGDEVFEHLVLRVEVHRLADELLEVEAVRPAIEVELDAVVLHALAVDAIGDARLGEHLGGRRLDDARLDGALDVFAAARVDDDGVDAGLAEQVGEQQSGGASPENADLGANGVGHGTIQGYRSNRGNAKLP